MTLSRPTIADFSSTILRSRPSHSYCSRFGRRSSRRRSPSRRFGKDGRWQYVQSLFHTALLELTVDRLILAVGVSDLLNKPKAKRELLDSLLGATGGAGGALGGLGGLGGLTSALPLGSLTSALPLGGALDSGSSTINGLLGQLQGAGASSSQLAGVLGQLQGLGLGSLPLSALTGSLSSATGAIQQQADTVTSSTPSPAAVQQATSILQGLTVAQAEQYGLLPSGTTGRLLNQIEAAIPDQSSTANNLASSVTGRTYGFKAQAGSNETTTDTGAAPAEDEGGATPTFAIASPEAVASAISAGGGAPAESSTSETPSSTSAAEMSKRTAVPSSASSMTPAASSTASSSAAKPTSDSMDDSASDYSDDDEDWEDSDMDSSDTEEPATPPPAPLARRGEENAEPDSEMSKKHHGGTEGQGPHASGAWHATESSSMAATQSQAIATAEAVRPLSLSLPLSLFSQN